LLEGCPIVARGTRVESLIPREPLLACGPFPSLGAAAVASALARGLLQAGVPAVDEQLLENERAGPALDAVLAAEAFDERLRRARALVLAVRTIERRSLAGSAAFELATRARQAGVPAYAVTSAGPDPFTARMLDVQVVLLARGARGIAAAGRKLAAIL
jgi:hypothetical protein